MIEKRSFESLGHADHGWLNARHHFSFANYHDPARMGWGSIRVWNDDEIGIEWPTKGLDLVLSQKDREGLPLDKAELYP